ncbi:response regulator transcription factor [Vacuolonema iberomarrocanum]|uniref:response regulator transcription factor n=1 Tax=Vacuolonema iberomarrocanum TaxID=3454632 RepID=UPI0019E158E1|nr:response regulator [filamentous cyanobacterium LEGE 07170]
MSQPCILIAEDEPRIVSFMERGLIRQGYRIVTTDRGDRAIDLVLENGFDLILLDIGLPVKDGWAVLDEMRAAHKDIPVIVITAHEGASDRLEQYADTVLGYIMKPFRFRTLVDMIRSQLDSRSS